MRKINLTGDFIAVTPAEFKAMQDANYEKARNRTPLTEIVSDMLANANDNEKIIKLDHGPELKIYLTHEQFEERLANGLGTTEDAISLISAEDALAEVNKHYTSRSQGYQEMNKYSYTETVSMLESFIPDTPKHAAKPTQELAFA